MHVTRTHFQLMIICWNGTFVFSARDCAAAGTGGQALVGNSRRGMGSLAQRFVSAEETMDSTPNRQGISFEELAYSNMLMLNALIELLDEKGLIGKKEILERVKRLQAQTQVRKKLH
jgi:hypothetical protein